MIAERSKKKIKVTGIDKKPLEKVLVGDNREFLTSLDLSKYNVIDLDAYGSPFDQLDILFDRNYTGCVFFTWCKLGCGAYPKQVSKYTTTLSPTPALGRKLLSSYLHNNGISTYNIIHKKRILGFNFYGQITM
jgi:hypothetical protein